MKKGIVNAVSLVLTLINLVLTLILVFTLVPAVNNSNAFVTKVAEMINMDIGGDDVGADSQVSITDLTTVDVSFGEDKTTTITLANGSDGKTHYLKLGVSLNLNTKHEDYSELSPSIETSMSMIDSVIIDVCSAYTYDNIDKAAMQNAVLKSLQELFNSSFIYSVSFGTYTVQ